MDNEEILDGGLSGYAGHYTGCSEQQEGASCGNIREEASRLRDEQEQRPLGKKRTWPV